MKYVYEENSKIMYELINVWFAFLEETASDIDGKNDYLESKKVGFFRKKTTLISLIYEK